MTTLRPIGAADEPVWRALWRDYLAFYDTELPDAVYRASFARLTDPALTDYHGIIALDAARPLGLVHYIFHRHGWQVEPVCYLQDLYVVPEARGQGLGRALIEAVYRAADRAGARGVYWLTRKDNATARRLYDRIGRLTPFVKYQRAGSPSE
jgi:GNAT superfamily N-acetyltransferase